MDIENGKTSKTGGGEGLPYKALSAGGAGQDTARLIETLRVFILFKYFDAVIHDGLYSFQTLKENKKLFVDIFIGWCNKWNLQYDVNYNNSIDSLKRDMDIGGSQQTAEKVAVRCISGLLTLYGDTAVTSIFNYDNDNKTLDFKSANGLPVNEQGAQVPCNTLAGVLNILCPTGEQLAISYDSVTGGNHSSIIRNILTKEKSLRVKLLIVFLQSFAKAADSAGCAHETLMELVNASITGPGPGAVIANEKKIKGTYGKLEYNETPIGCQFMFNGVGADVNIGYSSDDDIGQLTLSDINKATLKDRQKTNPPIVTRNINYDGNLEVKIIYDGTSTNKTEVALQVDALNNKSNNGSYRYIDDEDTITLESIEKNVVYKMTAKKYHDKIKQADVIKHMKLLTTDQKTNGDFGFLQMQHDTKLQYGVVGPPPQEFTLTGVKKVFVSIDAFSILFNELFGSRNQINIELKPDGTTFYISGISSAMVPQGESEAVVENLKKSINSKKYNIDIISIIAGIKNKILGIYNDEDFELDSKIRNALLGCLQNIYQYRDMFTNDDQIHDILIYLNDIYKENTEIIPENFIIPGLQRDLLQHEINMYNNVMDVLSARLNNAQYNGRYITQDLRTELLPHIITDVLIAPINGGGPEAFSTETGGTLARRKLTLTGMGLQTKVYEHIGTKFGGDIDDDIDIQGKPIDMDGFIKNCVSPIFKKAFLLKAQATTDDNIKYNRNMNVYIESIENINELAALNSFFMSTDVLYDNLSDVNKFFADFETTMKVFESKLGDTDIKDKLKLYNKLYDILYNSLNYDNFTAHYIAAELTILSYTEQDTRRAPNLQGVLSSVMTTGAADLRKHKEEFCGEDSTEQPAPNMDAFKAIAGTFNDEGDVRDGNAIPAAAPESRNAIAKRTYKIIATGFGVNDDKAVVLLDAQRANTGAAAAATDGSSGDDSSIDGSQFSTGSPLRGPASNTTNAFGSPQGAPDYIKTLFKGVIGVPTPETGASRVAGSGTTYMEQGDGNATFRDIDYEIDNADNSQLVGSRVGSPVSVFKRPSESGNIDSGNILKRTNSKGSTENPEESMAAWRAQNPQSQGLMEQPNLDGGGAISSLSKCSELSSGVSRNRTLSRCSTRKRKPSKITRRTIRRRGQRRSQKRKPGKKPRRTLRRRQKRNKKGTQKRRK